MNIAIFTNTPAQVHFYKNIIKNLKDRGNNVSILARAYGETLDLLDEYGMDYFVFSRPFILKPGMIFSLFKDIFRAYNYLKESKPDLISGFGVYDAYTSFLLRTPCVVFNDSEPMINPTYSIQFKLFMPFVDTLLTPESFRQYLGYKHLKISSYKELAYLHPDYYKPKRDVLDLLGISKDTDYVLLRFNALDAVHDAGIHGFSQEDKKRLVKELEQYCRVFISAEAGISSILQDYIINIPKSRIHDVLYYAKLFVTDTQTMTTESALLGTPTVRSNKFVGENDMGNFIELENKFGLIFNFRDAKEAIKKAIELIQIDGLKKRWLNKRSELLKKEIGITDFLTWFFEEYPKSLQKFRRNPEIQYAFGDSR
ncbi:MAG: DUF354 domain-containing protein [Elusimicrobiota bacterium]